MRKKLGNSCRRKEFNSPFQSLQKLVSPLQYRLTVLRFDAQALVDLGEVVHFYGRKENPQGRLPELSCCSPESSSTNPLLPAL